MNVVEPPAKFNSFVLNGSGSSGTLGYVNSAPSTAGTLNLTGTSGNGVVGNLSYVGSSGSGTPEPNLTPSSSGGSAFSLVQLYGGATEKTPLTLSSGSSVSLTANFTGLTAEGVDGNVIQVSALEITSGTVTAAGSLGASTKVNSAYAADNEIYPAAIGLLVGSGQSGDKTSVLTGTTGSSLSVSASLGSSATVEIQSSEDDTGEGNNNVTGIQVNQGDSLTWLGDVEIVATIEESTSNSFTGTAMGLEVNSGTATLNVSASGATNYDTTINVTSNQGSATGIGFNNTGDGNETNAISIGGNTLTITATANAGIADLSADTSATTQAVGIQVRGGTSPINITSDNISINAIAQGNESAPSIANGIDVEAVDGQEEAADPVINIGTGNTKTIEINATGTVSDVDNQDVIMGVYAPSATSINIGNKNSYTQINANVTGQVTSEWKGTLA